MKKVFVVACLTMTGYVFASDDAAFYQNGIERYELRCPLCSCCCVDEGYDCTARCKATCVTAMGITCALGCVVCWSMAEAYWFDMADGQVYASVPVQIPFMR